MDIQRTTELVVPPEMIGAHIGPSPAHSTWRATDLSYRAAMSLEGCSGFEWDILECTDEEIAQITAFVKLVKELRGLLHAGVWLLATGGDLGALSLPLPGLLWGLADAFACACLAIIPVKLIAKYGNFVVNGITFLLSGLILTPFVRPWAHAPAFDARGWWLLVFTVVVGTFVAFWLYMAGVVRIGSMRATMFGTIEPVAATVTAVMWTGAIFTPIDLIGFALILIMAFLVH